MQIEKLRLREYPHSQATTYPLKAAFFTSSLVVPKLEMNLKVPEKLKTLQGKLTLVLTGCQPRFVTHCISAAF